MDVYREIVDMLVAKGLAYESFSTPEEVEARRRAAGQDPKLGYDNADRDLTDEQKADFRAQGRLPVLRLRMPDTDYTWNDLVRGEVTFANEHVPDFVIVRNNGEPLYTLVNPVDDALMGITHVLRGEDLLSSTPRQIALYEALGKVGVTDGSIPQFGHLPYVMGEGNKKLSKRDPESNLFWYRDNGYLPEAMVNYLALLGWSIGDDREFFSLEEMGEAFDVERVNPNPARFDLKKATALNGDWIRSIELPDLTGRLLPRLQTAGVLPAEPTEQQLATLTAAVPLVRERMENLNQGVQMLSFLFVDDAVTPLILDDDARAMVAGSAQVLDAARSALAQVEPFTTEAIEQSLREALIEGLELKPKVAFGPVRAAVSGRRVSPPLFESIELLGRERTLARIDSALEVASAS
jgi:glutamyl-tRNA synthetase